VASCTIHIHINSMVIRMALSMIRGQPAAALVVVVVVGIIMAVA